MTDSTCLADDTIVAIVLGELAPPERTRASRHIRGCASCRSLVQRAIHSRLDVSAVRRAS